MPRNEYGIGPTEVTIPNQFGCLRAHYQIHEPCSLRKLPCTQPTGIASLHIDAAKQMTLKSEESSSELCDQHSGDPEPIPNCGSPLPALRGEECYKRDDCTHVTCKSVRTVCAMPHGQSPIQPDSQTRNKPLKESTSESSSILNHILDWPTTEATSRTSLGRRLQPSRSLMSKEHKHAEEFRSYDTQSRAASILSQTAMTIATKLRSDLLSKPFCNGLAIDEYDRLDLVYILRIDRCKDDAKSSNEPDMKLIASYGRVPIE